MKNTFAKEFVSKIIVKVSDKDLEVILRELEIFTNNYDIKDKCVDLVPYYELIPSCYKVYMISKKIEGLSIATLKTYDLYLKDFFCEY